MNARNLPPWKRSLSHEEWVDLKLSVGTHKKKRRLSPVEVAGLIQRIKNAGATLNEISKEILVGTSTISDFLRLNKVPPQFVALIDWGFNKEKISFKTASLATLISNQTERMFLFNKILEEGLTRNEMSKIIELRKRSELTIEQVINEVLNDRVIIIERTTMIGFIEDNVKSIINKMNIDTIDLEFKKLLKGVFPLVDIYSAKINTERFLLTTDEFGQSQIELKSRKEKMNYNSLIMINIIKIWGNAQ